jgi:hypothetical protein
MPTRDAPAVYHVRLLAEATRLAGGLTDVAQRAMTYHHLFEHSGRNHAFPAIAAHGALWSRGHFAFGLRLGAWLVWQYGLSAQRRRQQLAALAAFADAFRDINRRVCVETYAAYHFTARYGDDPAALQFVRPELLAALRVLHAARRAGRELPDADKRWIYEAHFLDEQRRVVGPGIERATAAFDWPLMRALALRPVLRFGYFPRGERFHFRRFDCREERIERGLQAFDLAAAAGWHEVTTALRVYGVLPAEFFAGTARHFAGVRAAVLATG